MDDLISTIQISPRSLMATRSARRPEGKDSSLTEAKPNDRSRRAVPRAIASAVSDWRPSGSGTRLRFWADDSIAGQHRTGCKKWKQVSYQGFRASLAEPTMFGSRCRNIFEVFLGGRRKIGIVRRMT